MLINRTDESATTYTWTDYLSKISPAWKAKVGAAKSVTWPVSGLVATGNEGVAGLVHDTPYSLGFVDFAWARKNGVRSAAVRNRAGAFVVAQVGSITAAAESAASTVTSDFRMSITDAPGNNSYPIAAFTYVLAPQRMEDPHKRSALSDFLKWMLTDGQKEVAGFELAPLPQNVVANEARLISLIKGQ